jgi:hypothetical protein
MPFSKAEQPSEYSIQCQVVEYLELLKTQGKVVLFTAIPNSTFTKSWAVKMKNKKSGVRPGLCDLFIITSTMAFFLELKREKGGVLSPEQKKWIEAIAQAGIPAFVAKGFNQAKNTIDALL